MHPAIILAGIVSTSAITSAAWFPVLILGIFIGLFIRKWF